MLKLALSRTITKTLVCTRAHVSSPARMFIAHCSCVHTRTMYVQQQLLTLPFMHTCTHKYTRRGTMSSVLMACSALVVDPLHVPSVPLGQVRAGTVRSAMSALSALLRLQKGALALTVMVRYIANPESWRYPIFY